MSSEPPAALLLPAPWDAFLHEVDGLLRGQVELHCTGGFVLHVRFGLDRPTQDVDYIQAVPKGMACELEQIAGSESKLAKKHRIYLHCVTICELPDSYEKRLVEMFPNRFSNLRLCTLDVHDLVLAKLTRNSPVDQEDVAFLAGKGLLDAKVLRERYANELRPYLYPTEKHDLTLKLWVDLYFPAPEGPSRSPPG